MWWPISTENRTQLSINSASHLLTCWLMLKKCMEIMNHVTFCEHVPQVVFTIRHSLLLFYSELSVILWSSDYNCGHRLVSNETVLIRIRSCVFRYLCTCSYMSNLEHTSTVSRRISPAIYYNVHQKFKPTTQGT